MKTIVITGPSGSGKSYLSNKLSKIFCNSIVIKTDSFYRDNILIRFLSKFLYDIYDRPLSIKKKELNKTIRGIYNKDSLVTIYKYDFRKKHSSQSEISINYKDDKQLLILEGIFAHRLDLNYEDAINIICEEEKEICFNRRVKRDQLERNRNRREVNMKFNKSWYLYYLNVKTYLKNNNVLIINPREKKSYNKLVLNIKNEEINN